MPMTDLIIGSEFECMIRSLDGKLSDRDLRLLLFKYCQLYQADYWFDQLANAFAYLEVSLLEASNIYRSELPVILAEVEEAMGEYFISLNEVATALYRLLDETVMTTEDAISAVSHVWNAHACNEPLEAFRQREDQILCQLIAKSCNHIVT
jgi:hypothetical protein